MINKVMARPCPRGRPAADFKKEEEEEEEDVLGLEALDHHVMIKN